MPRVPVLHLHTGRSASPDGRTTLRRIGEFVRRRLGKSLSAPHRGLGSTCVRNCLSRMGMPTSPMSRRTECPDILRSLQHMGQSAPGYQLKAHDRQIRIQRHHFRRRPTSSMMSSPIRKLYNSRTTELHRAECWIRNSFTVRLVLICRLIRGRWRDPVHRIHPEGERNNSACVARPFHQM